MYWHLAKIIFTAFKGSRTTIKRMEGSNEIISRLKFIGCLKTGEKINTRHMYVQPDGISTKISRTFFYQDNRNNALSFVKETINRSFELLLYLERSERESDKILCTNLVKDLHQAKKGLVHLKDTYISDTMFKCDMDTLLENIDARLKDLDIKYGTCMDRYSNHNQGKLAEIKQQFKEKKKKDKNVNDKKD